MREQIVRQIIDGCDLTAIDEQFGYTMSDFIQMPVEELINFYHVAFDCDELELS